jgi:H3 lysine-79-specific histone-lysine N-methyltransferase
MFTSTPKIRTKTIIMPVKRTPAQAQAPSSAPPANRYTLTPSTKARAVAQRPSLSVSRVSKRKVTPSTPQWASSDSEESEDEDRLGSGLRKRQKTSSSIEPTAINRCLEPDLRRRIRSRRPIKKDENKAKADSQIPELIHGSEMTRGEWVKLFKPAFKDHASVMVELQYPSPARPERFEIVIPRKDNDFNPLNDIYFSIEETIQHYLPPDLVSELSDETNGTVRLLKRAVVKDSPSDFKSVLADFNTLLKSKLKDGTITGILDNLHAIPLSLTNQILAQVYQRTVSPYAHLLRRVKGKETTYGELLPPFIHAIFHQTRLNSTHVFVDLGSGVGNVVLQSALQTGAESWGIEIMDTPAKYAERQARELRARSTLSPCSFSILLRLWRYL